MVLRHESEVCVAQEDWDSLCESTKVEDAVK